jgi:glycyl-tRNA synthetase beta chain
MATQNLLVELLVEELPPKALKKLGEAFAKSLHRGLVERRFVKESIQPIAFATPRRLGVFVPDVLSTGEDSVISEKIMPISIAFDSENKPTPALIKRLQKMFHEDINVESLLSSSDFVRKVEDGKEYLYRDAVASGGSLMVSLEGAINDALDELPIPKVMTYPNPSGGGWETVNFVRPAHSLVALHGADIVPVMSLGLTASNTTQGHRFEATKPIITIKNADSYAEQLASKDAGEVIASFAERRAEIERQLNAAATKENLKPIEDDALLDEVTALVERPNVLLGQFEEIYLEVPQECLILTMKANQKYFPLLDKNDKLTNKFLIVSNISPKDPSAVIQGNERVVRPRLADAKFFFDQDRKKTLESRIAGLNKVVYHNKLGSQGDRTERVRAIAKAIGQQLGGDKLATQADQAAMLAKADLVTDMVGEFPELQGIMGRYYAQHEGLDNDVAYAIEDHYKPRFAGDDSPKTEVGDSVALADKLETLFGMFGIGNSPTGDKDPFALRRHALGVISIAESLDERGYIDAKKIDVLKWLDVTKNEFKKFSFPEDTSEVVYKFILERKYNSLTAFYKATVVSAVLDLKPSIIEVEHRIKAVNEFEKLSEAPALAAANKRVGNILKKVEGEVKAEVKANLLTEPAEIALNDALSKVKPQADKLFESGDYTASLQALAALKAPVDDFFDNVMVNADDVNLKNNRLGLLAILHQTMNRVADLSKLAS